MLLGKSTSGQDTTSFCIFELNVIRANPRKYSSFGCISKKIIKNHEFRDKNFLQS